VPPDIEEEVADLYERGEYDRAKVLFRFLIDCFDDYAEGYNYLGLISLHEEKLAEAIGHFKKTIELGRKKFPRRIGRSRYWSDISTRPYMRGLMNLTIGLNRSGRYEEALMLCDRLERECGDDISPAAFRVAIYLNTGRWQKAADSALRIHRLDASESLSAGFALYELGREEEAVASFLHGALNFPRAARILVGIRAKSPKNRDEARDHNTGVDLYRDLGGYLRKSGRDARRFFKRVLKNPQVMKLIDELGAVTQRWRIQHGAGDRETFDRMNKMKKPEFARRESAKLTGILEG
jgi:tetratricopeptide (TPR) repeat protein